MRVVIVGCGRMGRLLARAAVAAKLEFCVVDRDRAALDGLGAHTPGRRIVGSGLDRGALLDAGVERADALAAVTGDDSTNVLVCLVARDEFRVPHVVARIHDPRQAEVYRRAGIPTVNPTALGATGIAGLLFHGEWHVQVVLGEGGVELVEAPIPYRLVGRSIDELNVPGEILVAGVTRQGLALVPYPGMALATGDRVHCIVRASSRGRLQRQLAQ